MGHFRSYAQSIDNLPAGVVEGTSRDIDMLHQHSPPQWLIGREMGRGKDKWNCGRRSRGAAREKEEEHGGRPFPSSSPPPPPSYYPQLRHFSLPISPYDSLCSGDYFINFTQSINSQALRNMTLLLHSKLSLCYSKSQCLHT